jgi:acyl carrier protein
MQNNEAIDIKKFSSMQISNSDPIDLIIKDVLADKLGIDFHLIQNESSLQDDLCIDSLDFTEIIMEIEKKFRIKIMDEEVEKFRTVGHITRSVKLKI